jgi:AAA15 family ATPase/GTPase
MLDSLDIRNYRNLKELRISSLERVNLITGKNNTGKSTILEAISIYATKGDFTQIYELLSERGENFKLERAESLRQGEVNTNALATNVRALSSLFTDRFISFFGEVSISIGSVDHTLFGEDISSEKAVAIRFIRYFDEIVRDSQNIVVSRKRTVLKNDDDQYNNFKIGFEIRVGDSTQIIPLDEDRPYRYNFKGLGNNENLQFIRTRNIDKEINAKLWDNIILTEKEQYVIDALRIIEPSTERIAFIEENSRQRTVVIKTSNINNVLPLRSMGDGINRILTIILALVNADNGFLLIDEFENGLHHTVQEKLWEVIFNLSKKLNVQIFATTHSEDCISGFERILNNSDNTVSGKLIRLDNIDGTIKEVEFTAQELKIATDQNIETR